MPSTYLIKDTKGNIVNTIIATEDFVSTNFEHYEEHIDEEKVKQKAREWRNQELAATDWIIPVTDHPQHAEYLTYREELRDWPATESFPDIRPELVI